MKKRFRMIALLGTMCLLAGCSKFSPDETAVSISKSGEVQNMVLEKLDKDYYNESELKSSIDQAVSDYQASAGEKSVSLKEFKVTSGTAKLELNFASPEDYASFNQVDFYLGTVNAAQEKGYTFDTTFQSVADGKSEKKGLAKNDVLGKDYQVLILAESMLAEVPGTIVFASENVEITGKSQGKATIPTTGAETQTEQATEKATGEGQLLSISPVEEQTVSNEGKQVAYILFE